MDSDFIVTAAGSLFASGTCGAVLAAVINRKKINVDNLDTRVTKIAGGLMDRLERTTEAQAARISELERLQQGHEDERDRWDRLEHEIRETLTVHAAFDHRMAQHLKDAGIDIGPVPPLLPPSMRP